MSADARILVASNDTGDAGLVRRLLSDEYNNVFVSTQLDRQVADFEQHRPEVLILAFKSLEASERYYLGLYRLSKQVHAIPHRTLILCSKDDVQRVYALCKREYFDDYILFWPLSQDAPRLPMSVFHALRQGRASESGGPDVAAFAAQARRLEQMESLLNNGMAQGREVAQTASKSIANAEQGIGAALEMFTNHLVSGAQNGLVEVKDPVALAEVFRTLRDEQIGQHVRSVDAAVRPVGQWIEALNRQLAPQLELARALQALAAQVHRLVLLVDDDPFQHALVEQLLRDSNLDLLCVGSGTEALASLRKRQPDLILMDVHLPDMDGVEATRRLKAVAATAAIPIIMITGQSDKDIVLQSLKAGAMDFLVKPLERERFLAKVSKGLGD